MSRRSRCPLSRGVKGTEITSRSPWKVAETADGGGGGLSGGNGRTIKYIVNVAADSGYVIDDNTGQMVRPPAPQGHLAFRGGAGAREGRARGGVALVGMTHGPHWPRKHVTRRRGLSARRTLTHASPSRTPQQFGARTPPAAAAGGHYKNPRADRTGALNPSDRTAVSRTYPTAESDQTHTLFSPRVLFTSRRSVLFAAPYFLRRRSNDTAVSVCPHNITNGAPFAVCGTSDQAAAAAVCRTPSLILCFVFPDDGRHIYDFLYRRDRRIYIHRAVHDGRSALPAHQIRKRRRRPVDQTEGTHFGRK